MPCDMGGQTYMGPTYQEREALKNLFERVAFLEQALCGLCQQHEQAGTEIHPQLREWFEHHKQQPGCEAGNQSPRKR